MKKTISITLCLCLFLCGCAPSFSAANGSVLDKDFIESFPFQSSALGTVTDWFNEHNDYTIKETDELNRSVYVTYKGNVDWYISASAGAEGVYGINGYYVMFGPNVEYSEQDWRTIYNCIVDELTDLCGNPVGTWNDGDCATFNYGQLIINVRLINNEVSLDMYYEA